MRVPIIGELCLDQVSTTDPVQVRSEVLKAKRQGRLASKAPKARNMTARGKREARRPWLE